MTNLRRNFAFGNFFPDLEHPILNIEPIDKYKRPLTNSQLIGWWVKDQPVNENLPWTKVKKHVFPKSEMTQ